MIVSTNQVGSFNVNFVISEEDMETLKNFKKIDSYGKSSIFPVYGGKM